MMSMFATIEPSIWTDPSPWLHAFGRAHVVLVHFPIAILIIMVLFEVGSILGRLLGRGSVAAPPTNTVISLLWIGLIAAIITAGSGWVYAAIDLSDDSRELLFFHRWIGISATSAALAAVIAAIVACRKPSHRARSVYRLLMVLCAGLIAATGHFGGMLVHGADHLVGPFTNDVAPPIIELVQITPADEAPKPELVVFQTQVWPILEQNCFKCHGPLRQRADLRLDQPSGLFGSNDDEAIIVPGDSLSSELVRRITLAPDSKQRMPRKAEPLTEKEIQTLIAWIEQGANWEYEVVGKTDPIELPNTTVELTNQQEYVDPKPIVLTPRQRQVRDDAIVRLRERGVHAALIAIDGDAIEVSFSALGEKVTDSDLTLLEGLESSLVWLDLSTTGISDDGLKQLSSYGQLKRLGLQQTGITDAGLENLVKLKTLEVLNLHSTTVTNEGIQALRPMNNLRRLYLWKTKVTLTGAANLRAGMPNVDINVGQ
ncbi:MAG: hypothetical protein IH984_04515 [Planctomycetes bacterium]|nr:hypothetical protein [Planctomycetota bacterium]